MDDRVTHVAECVEIVVIDLKRIMHKYNKIWIRFLLFGLSSHISVKQTKFIKSWQFLFENDDELINVMSIMKFSAYVKKSWNICIVCDIFAIDWEEIK